MPQESSTYADVMTSVFDNLLVKGQDAAWLASIRMEYSDHHSEDDLPSVGGFLAVACWAPSNYVQVMAAFNDRPISAHDLPDLDWQPIACHDSCWRDGVGSVIREAHDIVAKAAAATFSSPLKELSLYMHLDLLEQINPAVALATGIAKNVRHGQLSIPHLEAISASAATKV